MPDTHSDIQSTYKNTAIVGRTNGFDYVPTFSPLGTKIGDITPGPGHQEINEKLTQNARAQGAILRGESPASLASKATEVLVSKAKKKAKKEEAIKPPELKTLTFTTSAGKRVIEKVEGVSETSAGLMIIYPSTKGFVPTILDKVTVSYDGDSHDCQFHGLFFIWVDNVRSVLILFKLD